MENYLGRKIRELRRGKDWTQEQLADFLNVSYQSVSKWETGTAIPDLSFVIPLARLFGVSTDELLGFDQSMQDGSEERLPGCQAPFHVLYEPKIFKRQGAN